MVRAWGESNQPLNQRASKFALALQPPTQRVWLPWNASRIHGSTFSFVVTSSPLGSSSTRLCTSINVLAWGMHVMCLHCNGINVWLEFVTFGAGSESEPRFRVATIAKPFGCSPSCCVSLLRSNRVCERACVCLRVFGFNQISAPSLVQCGLSILLSGSQKIVKGSFVPY